ncbi:hypothetical protein Q1695_004364 [Nippostrongylus brasiliensis]|nr:hypothetical protein Q1695_004364 [Nippostrongylus brasiliensis]
MGKHENDNILPILNERPFHGTEKQEEYKKGISDANQKLLEVLKKTETNELLVALKEALAAEGSVLSKVKDFCNGDKRSDRRCAEVVQRFADAIDALVRGVSELPLESSMRQTISEAYTNYEDEYYGSENSDYAQLALTLAETVAAALPSQN